MKTTRFIACALAAVALAVTALSVNSCKPKGAEIAVTGISVSQPSISLNEGETAVISYSVEPTNASVKDVSFSSSDNGVATVDDSGRVTAVAPGTATITVSTKDGGFKATVNVTVKSKDTPGPPTPADKSVTGIKLSDTDITLGIGEAFSLTATIEPEDATDKTIEWKSDKPTVAIVDDYGNVTAMAIGSARIIATSKSNPSVSSSCYVTVKDKEWWEYIPNKTLSVDGSAPVTLKSVGLYYDSEFNGYDIVFLENDVKTFGKMSSAPDGNFLVIDLSKGFLGERTLDKSLNDIGWMFYCVCREFVYKGENGGVFGSGHMKLEINESAKTISFAIDGKHYYGHTIKCRYEGSYIKSEEYIYEW